MLGGSQGLGGTGQRTGGLWPLASAPVSPATNFTSDGYSKYGFYSLFSGAPTFGSALYSHNTMGRFGPALQAPTSTAFHTTHKVSDSLFSATGYTFGAATPPPGSPYSSPVPVAQLEFLTKGYTTTTNSNIIIQQSPICHTQQADHLSPTKKQIIITPTSDKEFKIGGSSAFRASQSTFKHHQQQYIYSQPAASNDGPSCMLKLTTLDQKDCHSTGCSRTNPLEWTALSPVHVKKEPGTLVLSGDHHHHHHHHHQGAAEAAIIKMEMTSPVQKVHHDTSAPSIVTANGSIPVGIAVGRQRIQQEVAPSGILTTTHFKEVARISEIADLNAAHHHTASSTLQHHHQHHQHHNHLQHGIGHQSAVASATADCWGLMGSAAAAVQQHQQHCHPGAAGLGPPDTGPHGGTTLWTTAQYPTPLPMEPLLPMSAVGLPLQLIREPTSGGFLLFPTAGIEPVHQTAAIQLWPSNATTTTATTGHVILPPLPPPPLQLLTSAAAAQAHAQQQDTFQHLSMIQAATVSSVNSCNNSCNGSGLITTISNNNSGLATVNTINHHQIKQHNVFEHQQAKLMASKAKIGAVIKVEEGSTILQQQHHHHHQQMTHEIAENCQQDVPPSNLQIFDGTPPILTTTHLIYQPTQTPPNSSTQLINNIVQASQSLEQMLPEQTTWKQTVSKSTSTCRSQATSPVTCLTPPPETGNTVERTNGAIGQEEADVPPPVEEIKSGPENVVSEKVRTDEKLLMVHDASNQTEAISDEESTTDAHDKRVPSVDEEESDRKKVEHEEETVVPAPEMDSIVETLKPDFSGLDLLSNSILEHETTKTIVGPAPPEVVPEIVVPPPPLPLVEENLAGLDLLCALAEQRLVEEEKVVKPDLVKSRRNATDEDLVEEPEAKKAKLDENSPRRCNNCNCNVDDEPFKNYKTKESEQEFKKFIASKAPSLMEYHYKEMTTNGLMNDSERDMRQQLADLQKKYKEKQRELNKLKPHNAGSKKLADCQSLSQPFQKKKHRKKSTNSSGSTDRDTSPQPPVLEPQVDLLTVEQNIMLKVQDVSKDQSTTTTTTNKPIEKRRQSSSNCLGNPLKRRRKVGRPKKLEWSSDNDSSSNNNNLASTETIVAKKPKKAHQNLVGYLLAAKEKLLVQKPYSTDSPPRFIEEVPTKISSTNKKIGPKLKAEARISTEMSSDDFLEEEKMNKPVLNEDSDTTEEPTITEAHHTQQQQSFSSTTEEQSEDNAQQNNSEFSSDDSRPLNIVAKSLEVPAEQPRIIVDTRCILTQELLESDRLRVLTAMGGLFYAGHLNAVEPPDVYSITLDGERGNKPHIMSREDILRDAIVEVSPTSIEDLSPGTRLCAYWSQQYRCLYPGSVAEPASPSASPARNVDKRFVAVEFDDGDNGTIAIEDIRLLPSDYPIIEYDPNPLLSLSKRRRRLSTTEDRKFTQSPSISVNTAKIDVPQLQPVEKENYSANTNCQMDKTTTDGELRKIQRSKERKHLKKRKRDKLREKRRCQMNADGETLKKKKKRKHKCLGEQCKHKRHHKKHKKHHRRHQKRDNRDKEAVNEAKQVNPEEEEKVERVEAEEVYPEYHIVPIPDDEVTMDEIIEDISKTKSKKIRDRQESCESRSKMSAFLPPRQFWSWCGKGYKRPRGKGRSKKEFFKSIQRGKENMTVGDSAVFLSTGRPDRPYIGKIEAFWETCGTMVVKVKWFYHPEETNGCPPNLKYPGALFESPHIDENDVQTISHRCRVVALAEYTATLGTDPTRYATIYDNNDIYYRAGYYDPTTCQLSMDTDIALEDE